MRFEYYKAADGWRWRLKAANGKIIADGGEAYATRYNVRCAIMRFRGAILNAPSKEIEE